MSRRRFLVLGGGEGWHADQLRTAAATRGDELVVSAYETITSEVDANSPGGCRVVCDAGSFCDFDAILTRTMPAGSLEQITFRLATLHRIDRASETFATPALVNRPGPLEIAIDKFATLAHVAGLGYPVPRTVVAQSRSDAMDAFDQLGGDCVVKPIFGGEGRGVMRVRDRQLAWYAFSTLEQLDAVAYLQEFVRPGGVDTRMLVIGDQVSGFRRRNGEDFRTNVSSGGSCEAIELDDSERNMAKRIVESIGLTFASVDLIDTESGPPCVLEVNGIPGWKGAQSVAHDHLADAILQTLHDQADAPRSSFASEVETH